MTAPRTVLITGCSTKSLGSALAREFHVQGLRVFATARFASKMLELEALGISILELDIENLESIYRCATQVSEATGGVLDILVNNAGIMHASTILDEDRDESRKCFSVNFFGSLDVTKAFFPLLYQSRKRGDCKPLIVNHTSIAAGMPLPTQGIYAASKAAMSSLSNTMRLEFRPFGIRVVELRTGKVESNIYNKRTLPKDSMYTVAKTAVESSLNGDFNGKGDRQHREEWAAAVVADLLRESPGPQVWKGNGSALAWLAQFLPSWLFETSVMDMTGMLAVEKALTNQNP